MRAWSRARICLSCGLKMQSGSGEQFANERRGQRGGGRTYLQSDNLKQQLGSLVIELLGAVGVVAHQLLLLDGAHGAEGADGGGALEKGVAHM